MINTTLHKNIMLRILKDIYTDQSIAPALGFKGGTAAFMFYGLTRFSVDLDFDLLDVVKEDDVFEKVKIIVSQYGKLKESLKKRFNLFFLLSYEERAQNIKVEINRRNFGSAYHVSNYLGVSMKVMVKQDMVAHKLLAMYERFNKTNRDIYDVWFFLQNNWPINRDIVEKRSGMPFKEFLEKCIDLLEKKNDRGILSGLGDFLTPEQKIWGKAHLRQDTIFNLKVLLDTFPPSKPLTKFG